MNLPLRKKISFAVTLLCLMLATGTAVLAQPPMAPDQRPKAISPDDLDRAIGGPTLVTLNHQQARPELVFHDLAKQAGVLLDPYESTALLKKLPSLSISVEKKPVLLVLHTLASQLELSFTLKSSLRFEQSPTWLVLQLKRGNEPQTRMSGPLLSRGPFVVIATSIQRTRTIALTGDPKQTTSAAQDGLSVDFVILGDPRLRRQGILGSPTFFSRKGWTIRSADNESPWKERTAHQGPALLEWRFTAHRNLTSDEQRVPSLRATATSLLVTTRSKTWEISDLLAVKDAKRDVTLAEGDRRYTLHGITVAQRPGVGIGAARQDVSTVRVSVSGVGFDNDMWSGWPPLTADHLVSSLRLVDSNGADFLPESYQLQKRMLSVQFSNLSPHVTERQGSEPTFVADKPAKLLWSLPAEIRTVEIPIDFADLPMPGL